MKGEAVNDLLERIERRRRGLDKAADRGRRVLYETVNHDLLLVTPSLTGHPSEPLRYNYPKEQRSGRRRRKERLG